MEEIPFSRPVVVTIWVCPDCGQWRRDEHGEWGPRCDNADVHTDGKYPGLEPRRYIELNVARAHVGSEPLPAPE